MQIAALPRLILASSSAYRRELLGRLQLPFEAIAPDIDETPHPGETPQLGHLRSIVALVWRSVVLWMLLLALLSLANLIG